ncbi:MAG: hypothetical protein LBF78_13345 [Treponema sp.]|jgi:alpha-tubulin suppressor-like RCC1 family protein|nr:hypothetical protein [Treponema sp.]
MQRKTGCFYILALFFIFLLIGESCKTTPPDDGPAGVLDIFPGVADVFILREDGSLWNVGYNQALISGIGGASGAAPGLSEAMQGGVPFTGAKAAASGETHRVILKDDGSLWGQGKSVYGELGLGGGGQGRLDDFTSLGIGDVKSLVCGNNSTFVIKNDGTLWASGYNYYGELGIGDRTNHAVFTQSKSAGNGVKAVAVGVRHSVILKDDGSVWAAGYNFNGQLGLGNQDDSAEFIQVTGLGNDVLSVAAGNYHTAVLKKDGSVWTAGENYYGQLGTSDPSDRRRFFQVKDSSGNPLTGAKAIAARGDLTLILKEDNSLLWAGNYLDPAPRDENNLPPEKPAEEEKSTLKVLVPDGAGPAPIGEIQKIGLGFQSIYIISSGGRLWVAGSNRYGQLGLDYDTEVLHNLRIIYPGSE